MPFGTYIPNQQIAIIDSAQTARMFHPIFESLEKLVPIPKEFRSLYGTPFNQCIECEKELLKKGSQGENQQYLVERVFRGSEPIIEYAICPECHARVCDDLSSESLETLRGFFSEHLSLFGNPDLYATKEGEEEDLERWLSCCRVTNAPISETREYQMIALCEGDKMVLGPISPFVISGAVLEEAGELLSVETRDRMDDFIGSNFGMPSEFCDSPRPVLL